MGLFPDFINGKKVIDFEDKFFQSAVLSFGTNGNILVDFRTKSGKQAYIVAHRMAWDSGLDPNVTLRLLVEGHNQYPYDNTTVQLAPPEQEVFLPTPIPVGQNARIQTTADIAGSTNGRVTSRVMIAYTDLYTQ